ncbi:MAG: SMP-30/gluconolactonase/LRE family protein [Gammaproteobacteria bacterium]|nr:SMP-30/gluconolactonase/LRE family protein [Gammaproteobacteria bacterium]
MHTSRRSLLQLVGACTATIGIGGVIGACAREEKETAPSIAAVARTVENPIESLEIIGSGYIWTEGPVWLGDENGQLLFSDVPGNTIYSWVAREREIGDGEYSWDGATTSVFLHPSGLDASPMPDYVREGGANGLALGRGGVVICDSGNRCISVIDLETRERTVLVDRYEGKRLNSPNDIVVARNGDIYFTDPPYGLVGVKDSPLLELDFTGVFRITPDNQLHVIADDLFPNGIGLSPDHRILYVNSRSGRMAFDLDSSGNAVGRRLFTSRESPGGGGDGFTVDASGKLWCLSRGGIHVFTPDGQRIGYRQFDGRTSNCAFGPGGYLYITNGDRVLRCKISEDFV